MSDQAKDDYLHRYTALYALESGQDSDVDAFLEERIREASQFFQKNPQSFPRKLGRVDVRGVKLSDSSAVGVEVRSDALYPCLAFERAVDPTREESGPFTYIRNFCAGETNSEQEDWICAAERILRNAEIPFSSAHETQETGSTAVFTVNRFSDLVGMAYAVDMSLVDLEMQNHPFRWTFDADQKGASGNKQRGYVFFDNFPKTPQVDEKKVFQDSANVQKESEKDDKIKYEEHHFFSDGAVSNGHPMSAAFLAADALLKSGRSNGATTVVMQAMQHEMDKMLSSSQTGTTGQDMIAHVYRCNQHDVMVESEAFTPVACLSFLGIGEQTGRGQFQWRPVFSSSADEKMRSQWIVAALEFFQDKKIPVLYAPDRVLASDGAAGAFRFDKLSDFIKAGKMFESGAMQDLVTQRLQQEADAANKDKNSLGFRRAPPVSLPSRPSNSQSQCGGTCSGGNSQQEHSYSLR